MCLAEGAQHAVPADQLARMALDKLRHRGPDGFGVVGDARSAVAMCRLRVRSRRADTVPFAAPDSRTAYAFNGEVYAIGLDARSPEGGPLKAPQGGLDEAEAVDVQRPTELDGIYALVRRTADGSLGLTRDPIGIKPLYLRRDRAGVAVASEIPALLELFGPASIRPEAIAQFLLFGRVVDGGTFFENIEPVAPGARLILRDGQVRRLAIGPAGSLLARPRASVRPARIRAAVIRALDRVLVSDRPLGLALSGGLDSTILAAELSSRGMSDLSTVSVLPRGNGDGVRDLAALALPGTSWRSWRHRSIEFGPNDLLDGIPDAVRALGEPTAMTSVPMYAALARLARESGIVVLIIGEGADEVFCGYRSYLGLAGATKAADFYLTAERAALLRDLVGTQTYEAAQEALAAALPAPEGRDVGEVVREFEQEHSLEPLLRRADHLLMAEGVEGRTPFLHGGLPALAALLPFGALVRGGQTKVPLRQAYAAELPHYVNEVKKPFRAPVDVWLTGHTAPGVRAELARHRERLAGVGLRPAALDSVLDRIAAGDAAVTGVIFPLLTLGAWLEWLTG